MPRANLHSPFSIKRTIVIEGRMLNLKNCGYPFGYVFYLRVHVLLCLLRSPAIIFFSDSIPLSFLPPTLSSFSTSNLKQFEVVPDPYEKPLPSLSVTYQVIVLFIFVIKFKILKHKSNTSVIFVTASIVTSIPHRHHSCHF